MNFLFNDDMCLKVCMHCPVIQGPKIITCLIKKIKNLNRQVLRVFFFFLNIENVGIIFFWYIEGSPYPLNKPGIFVINFTV